LLVALADTVVSCRPNLRIATALVSLDRRVEVVRATVVEEEDLPAEASQRRRAKLVAAGRALEDVVGEPGAHRVERHVGAE